MVLLSERIHDSWNEFLTIEILDRLDKIESQIGENFNPEREFVLRFLNSNIFAMQVVILGQDPYPSPIATGRAFEVKNLTSWMQPFKQVSLKNIVRLLYKTYQGIENYSDIPSFDEIKEKIRRGEFRILPPHQLFESWDKQGVLLLNTYLTCEKGISNSHREIWGDFAVEIIRYIVKKNPCVNWFLWGKEANQYSYLLPQNRIYKSRHPMMCNETYTNDFLKSDCFQKTMDRINWLGI
jgi:uracil-DNA glycosylase